MIDSKGSVVVGDQGALGGGIDEPVVPYAGGEGEQALGNPNDDAGSGATAMLLKTELALESVVDGLDALADPAQRSVAAALVAAVRPHEGGSEFPDEALQFPTGIPL